MTNDNRNLPCLGCSTELPPEATGCPICLRGRTPQEILRGYAKLRAAATAKRRRPYLIAAAVVVLGVSGWLVATYRQKIKAAAGALARRVDAMRDPKNYAPQAPAPAAPRPPAAPGEPASVETAVRAQLMSADTPPANPAPAPPPVSAPPQAAPAKALATNAWRVSGTVYDLKTLEPVADAEITFVRHESETETTMTDAHGEYEIDLAKGDGWTVSLISARHRRGQVLDIDPPYRVRDTDERLAAMNALTDGDLAATPVDWSRGHARVRLDLVAVPPLPAQSSPP